MSGNQTYTFNWCCHAVMLISSTVSVQELVSCSCLALECSSLRYMQPVTNNGVTEASGMQCISWCKRAVGCCLRQLVLQGAEAIKYLGYLNCILNVHLRSCHSRLPVTLVVAIITPVSQAHIGGMLKKGRHKQTVATEQVLPLACALQACIGPTSKQPRRHHL